MQRIGNDLALDRIRGSGYAVLATKEEPLSVSLLRSGEWLVRIDKSSQCIRVDIASSELDFGEAPTIPSESGIQLLDNEASWQAPLYPSVAAALRSKRFPSSMVPLFAIYQKTKLLEERYVRLLERRLFSGLAGQLGRRGIVHRILEKL